MNKKALFALMALTPLSAMAAPNNVGCGFGTMIFNGQSGVAPQVLAATTNGIFFNQAFGISTGTLGCSRDGVVANPVQVSLFIGTNLDKLAQDMSVGQGETLAAVAQLLGIDDGHKAAFFKVAKNHFAEIIPSDKATTEEVIVALKHVLSRDAELHRYAVKLT